MRHVQLAEDELSAESSIWLQNLTGRYYTHEVVGAHLAKAVWTAFAGARPSSTGHVSVCDPFGGDGRLVEWLIEAAGRHSAAWRVELWDLNGQGLKEAEKRLDALSRKTGVHVEVKTRVLDSFAFATDGSPEFDIVITNPPWENLKPDGRELRGLDPEARSRYVAALRETDITLGRFYPLSQPSRKFAGWGTNLARVGTELAVRITKPGGVLGVVSPASFFADDTSSRLRGWILTESELLDVAYFPAEARLFGKADVPAATFVARRSWPNSSRPNLTTYDHEGRVKSQGRVHITKRFLEASDYLFPISLGHRAIKALEPFSDFGSFSALESRRHEDLWAGRELDETGVARFLEAGATGNFIKGKMIGRFAVRRNPDHAVVKPGWEPPRSVSYERIAWRDVSRPSQKRRVQAALIPPGWIAGNSLGVAHFKDGNSERLRALLGVMSSFAFEFQLRSMLATGHVTLTSLRRVRIPPLNHPLASAMADAVRVALAGGPETMVEVIAARMYGLDAGILAAVIGFFPKVTDEERSLVLAAHADFAHS